MRLNIIGNEVADYMTEPMVAQFYGVRKKTIEQIANRNKEELSKFGYRLYKRDEIISMQVKTLENIPNRGLRLYPINAVLFIGLNYLTDSKMADEIKRTLPKISPDLFLKLSKGKSKKRKEADFLDQLEDVLKPFGLKGIKQYSVINKYGTRYRIDYYIPDLNIAIEYDENDHESYTYEAHEGRQMEIEDILGCRFIRVSDSNTNSYNIGLVIKEIFQIRWDI